MKVVDVDGAVDVARVRFQGRALSDAAGRRYRVQQIGGHHALAKVTLHFVPKRRGDREFTRSATGFSEEAATFVDMGGKYHEFHVAVSGSRAAVVKKAFQEIVHRLSGSPRRAGFWIEAVARAENMADDSVDTVRIRSCREDHQKVNRPFATHRKLAAWQDCRHRDSLIGSLSSERIELRLQVPVPVDAVVIRERDDIDPGAVCSGAAGSDEAFGDLGKALRPLLLERLDGRMQVLSETLLRIEGGMDMKVATQPPRPRDMLAPHRWTSWPPTARCHAGCFSAWVLNMQRE